MLFRSNHLPTLSPPCCHAQPRLLPYPSGDSSGLRPLPTRSPYFSRQPKENCTTNQNPQHLPTQCYPAILWHPYPRNCQNPPTQRRRTAHPLHNKKTKRIPGLARRNQKILKSKIICRSLETCTPPKQPTYWEYLEQAPQYPKSSCAPQWPAACCFQTLQCACCSAQNPESYRTNS